jgi:hypothetical protein
MSDPHTDQSFDLLELARAGKVQRPPPKFSGDNNETLNSFNSKQWNAAVKQLDQVLTDWEKAVEAPDDTNRRPRS